MQKRSVDNSPLTHQLVLAARNTNEGKGLVLLFYGTYLASIGANTSFMIRTVVVRKVYRAELCLKEGAQVSRARVTHKTCASYGDKK